MNESDWIALGAGLLSATVAIFIYRRSGARVKFRAFMFCWRGTSNWKVVIEARNLGRIPASIDILGVEYDVVHPSNKETTEIKKLKFEYGPDLPYELKPRSAPTIWITGGTAIHGYVSYGYPQPGTHGSAVIVVRDARWRPRKIKVKGTPGSWDVSKYIDDKLGWTKSADG